jgi:choline dehydrogenase-like flavoprotein
LLAAARMGRFTLVSDAIASGLLIDHSGRAKGVHYIDRVTREHRQVYVQVVAIAAGALESTRILLNSRSPAHPQGVGNANGVLGHAGFPMSAK